MRQSDDQQNSRPFAAAVLTTWDFSLSSEIARKHVRNTIATNLKALLGQAEIERLRNSLTTMQRLKRFGLRFIANILILVVYAISGTLVFYSVFFNEKKDFYLYNLILMPQDIKEFTKNFISGKTSIIIAILNVVVLNVFYYIGKMEFWDSPMKEVSLLVARSFFFKIASLYLIVVSTLTAVPDDQQEYVSLI